MQGELGVVRAGARADLVLVEKNPLVDVANAARRVGVMVRGRWLSSDELRRRLTDLAASYSDKQDPFARLPPLSCRGAQAFRGHYEILWREKVVGAERFAVCRAADGATRVAAQATDDYDRASYRLTIEHGARGEQSLTAQSERSEGPGRLDLTVAGGIFTLRRRLPAEEREERRQSAAGASSLGGESVESLALIKHRFTSLAVGQTTRVPMRQVGLGAGLKVRSTDLEITRQAGTVTAPRGVETRHYRITTVAGGKAVLEQRLTTDAQGWPVRLETSGKYAITFRRVSP
jgi:hypothetical protein